MIHQESCSYATFSLKNPDHFLKILLSLSLKYHHLIQILWANNQPCNIDEICRFVTICKNNV